MIADLAAFGAKLFFMPGDWLLRSVVTHAPAVARVLELGTADVGGPLSACFSAFAWAALLVFAAITFQAIKDLDDALTGAIVRGWSDARTRMRIMRRLAVYRLRELRKPPSAGDACLAPDAEELVLDDDAVKLLRALAAARAARGLPLRDAAKLLGRGKRDARQVLERLKSLQLARSTIGTLDGETAYVLTQAGRGFLIFKQLGPKRAGAAN